MRATLLAAVLLAALMVSAPTAAAPKPLLAKARSVTATAVSPSAVRVQWRATGRRETRWEVRSGTTVRRLGRTTRRVTFKGLAAGRRYGFSVRACRGTRCSKAVRVAATTLQPPGPAGSSTTLAGCPLFPADNAWNRDISSLPVHADSARFLASIGTDDTLHPDFGSGRLGDYGIPYEVVPADQARVPIRFTAYGDESDPGPYPVPLDARIEGGSDDHVLVLQQGSCKLFELYRAVRSGDGFNADSGAVWDLRSNALRREGWTSADAAGLPILPGLARPEEASTGTITHALRFTVSRTQKGYIHPATHFASSSDDPALPPMGLRLRMKAGFDVSGYRGQSRAILEALKRYGMIVADNGSDWFISGAADPRWDDDDIEQLKRVPATAFEVVDTGPIRRP